MPDLPLSAGVSTSLALHTDQATKKEAAVNAAESFETVLRDKVKQNEAPEKSGAVSAPTSKKSAAPSNASTVVPTDAKTQNDEGQLPAVAKEQVASDGSLIDPGLAVMLLQLQSGKTEKILPDTAEAANATLTDSQSIAANSLSVQNVVTTQGVAAAGNVETAVFANDASGNAVPLSISQASEQTTVAPSSVVPSSVVPSSVVPSSVVPSSVVPSSVVPSSVAPSSLPALIANTVGPKGTEPSQGKPANTRSNNVLAPAIDSAMIDAQTAEQVAVADLSAQAASSGRASPASPLAVAKSADPLPAAAEQANSGASKSDFSQLLDRASASLATTQHQPPTQATQATQNTNAITLQQPAGQAAWQNELGDKMVWMANSQRQQADLVLNPPQLGRVEVSLTISGDQASAVFASPNAAVREMLENSLPRLREIFAGAGIDLGEAHVNTGQSQQQFAGNDRNNQPGNQPSARGTMSLEHASGPIIAGTATAWSSSGKGLVDTFA